MRTHNPARVTPTAFKQLGVFCSILADADAEEDIGIGILV